MDRHKERTTFRLLTIYHEQLKRLAKKRKTTLQALIGEALEAYLTAQGMWTEKEAARLRKS